jgi:hypothetical protein
VRKNQLIGRVVAAALGTAAVALAAPGIALADDVTVSPGTVRPGGSFRVTANCGSNSDSASVSATTIGGASNVQMASSSSVPGEWFVDLTMPAGTLPGSYDLGGTCGNGTGFNARVVVVTTGPQGGGGWAAGGPDSTLITAGAGMLALAAIGGAVLIQRRRGDAPVA